MKVRFRRDRLFVADVQRQFAWYWDEVDLELAWRFETAVEDTLHELGRHPQLGRRRRFRHPLLVGLRSFRVEPPFSRFLIFYRADDGVVDAWRLMHGGRDLSRRLVEPPDSD